MKIEAYHKNGFLILKVLNDLSMHSSLAELREEIKEYLEKGERKIGLSFTPGSYLNSQLAADLVLCYQLISDEGGEMIFIQPNPEILRVLTTIGFTTLVKVYSSEEEIGTAAAHAAQ
jgi:anti-anti-sigma factor